MTTKPARRTTGAFTVRTADGTTRTVSVLEATMHRSTVGGYQGPVEILTGEDQLLGEAACRYRAEEDAGGVDRWQGRLHRINPPDAVAAGLYRLRFDGGRLGDIAVGPVGPGDRVVYFEGVGARPPP